MYMYTTTFSEDWIKELYGSIHIQNPSELSIKSISLSLGVDVLFKPISSRYIKNTIIIDSRLSKNKQWEDFGHEICHMLRHYGNQLTMPKLYFDLQEGQAKADEEQRRYMESLYP